MAKLIILYILSQQSSVDSRQSEDRAIYTFQSRFIGNVISSCHCVLIV